MAHSATAQKSQVRRKRIFDYPLSYWTDVTAAFEVLTVETEADQKPTNADPEPPTISDNPVCQTCGQNFASFVLQRAHFRADWHKYNLHRRVRGHGPLSEDDFDALSDLGSVESLSGSESELSGDEFAAGTNGGTAVPTARLSQKLEFRDPRSDTELFLVVYRAALPDQTSLGSLAQRGSWAVIMTGGGHFCAAIWDAKGVMLRHKTFHRYTSRRKQGGSQAAADESRGNANRIKSAGATLRRYGEQALQKEVHELLKQWQDDLTKAQCIYIRASQREKRDLLVGWQGSPLKVAEEKDALRNIPLPTRRPTLKEAQRVYEELTTIRVSPASLVKFVVAKETTHGKTKESTRASKGTILASSKKPDVKGTDHLKKRDDKEKRRAKNIESQSEKTAEPEPKLEVDEKLVEMLNLVKEGKKELVLEALRANESLSTVLFEPHYLVSDKRFEKVEEGVGLIGVAAAYGHGELVEHLLDNGVSPAVGLSPYGVTKAKAMRVLLRKYWGAHPDKYDYLAAGIPSPLNDAELQEMAEREKMRRRRDREKKKEKAREKAEAAKPPEVKARELRAAAAEARMLGNRCAWCKKNLEGVVPFERLAFKYCSTECVSRHRQVLSRM